MIKLNYFIKPVAKGRPRMTRQGHAYTPEKTRSFQNHIVQLTKLQISKHFIPYEKQLSVEIKFFFRRSKSNKDKYHVKKPDLDNLIKSVCDSLNGIIYKDDSQIFSLYAYKHYSDEDSIEITINEHDVY